MPIQFQPFVSLYSDPGIKEISTDLKTRYYENLKAKDALASALDNMVALAPDEETKAQIRAEADAALEQISKDPALENQGMQIYNAVKGFDKKYSQVKKQYDTAMAELQTLEQKKEKREIEPEYYDLIKANFFKNYKGVKFDDKGRLIQGSTFKAPTYYNSVDINEKLLKQLGILSPEETKTDIESFQLSPDGTTYIAKKGNTETSISLDRVRDAYNAILQSPDIDRYINDKVDKRYNLLEGIDSKTNLLQSFNNSIDMSNSEYENQINKNNELINSIISISDKLQLQNQNKQLKEVIDANNLKKKTNTGFINQLNQGKENEAEMHIKSLIKDGELSAYKQYGDAKAFTSKSYTEGIDQTYKNLKAQEALDANKWLMENPEFKAQGVVTAAQWGGIDTKAKKENIAMYQQTVKQLQEALDKGKENGSLSPELIKQYESQIQGAKNAAEDVQAQIDAALRKTISDADIKSIVKDKNALIILKEMYPDSATNSYELINKIINIFDNEGDQDYLDFKTKYTETYGIGSWNKEVKVFKEVGPGERAASAGEALAGINQEKKLYTDIGSEIKRNLDEFISDKIDPAYKEIKESPMFDYGAITSVSNDPVEVRRLTNAVNKYFTDKPIGENLKVTVQGSPGDDIGNTEFNDAGIAEITGKDLAGYTAKKIGYSPIAGSKGLFQVELSKGGDQGSNIVVLIDGQQLAGTELDKAVNRPEVSIARLINKLDPRDVDSQPRTRTIRIYDDQGNIIPNSFAKLNVRTGETGKPEVAVETNVNGIVTVDPYRPMNSRSIIDGFSAKHANGNPIYELLD